MLKPVPMGLLLYGSSSCVFVVAFDVVQTKPANIKTCEDQPSTNAHELETDSNGKLYHSSHQMRNT
jgi:hypothetical protein